MRSTTHSKTCCAGTRSAPRRADPRGGLTPEVRRPPVDNRSGGGVLRHASGMVYALDPSLHRVWRTPDILQFGVDRPRLTLHGVTISEERMLVALEGGTTMAGLLLAAGKGADAASVEHF